MPIINSHDCCSSAMVELVAASGTTVQDSIHTAVAKRGY